MREARVGPGSLLGAAGLALVLCGSLTAAGAFLVRTTRGRMASRVG